MDHSPFQKKNQGKISSSLVLLQFLYPKTFLAEIMNHTDTPSQVAGNPPPNPANMVITKRPNTMYKKDQRELERAFNSVRNFEGIPAQTHRAKIM